MSNIQLDLLALLCPEQAAERDAAFTEAIMSDNWDPVRDYSTKHHLPIPEAERAFKLGVCKAAYHSLSLPLAVKIAAADMAWVLGSDPYIT